MKNSGHRNPFVPHKSNYDEIMNNIDASRRPTSARGNLGSGEIFDRLYKEAESKKDQEEALRQKYEEHHTFKPSISKELFGSTERE